MPMTYDELENAYNAVKRKLKVTGDALERVIKEVNDLRLMQNIMVAEKKQWVVDKENQARIIQDTMNRANTKHEEDSQEINRLKDEIRRLKGIR